MVRWLVCCLPLWLLAGSVGLATCPAPVVTHQKVIAPYVSNYVAPYVQKEVVATVVPVAVYQPLTVVIPTYTAAYVPSPTVVPAPQPVAPAPAPMPAPVQPPQPGGTPLPAPVPGTPGTKPTDPFNPTNPGNGGMAEILIELRRINGRLDVLERGGTPPPPPVPGTPVPNPAPVPGKPKPTDPFNPDGEPPGAAGNTIKPQGNVTAPDSRAVASQKCAQCHQAGREKEGGDFVLTDASGNFRPLTGEQQLALYKHIDRGTMPKRNNKYGITPLSPEEAGALLDFLASVK